MLEDSVQTPVVENPLPEELPAELPSPELPEGVTLPEPPVEVEASGLGELENLLQPTTPTEAEVSVEETGSDDGLITADVKINADAVLEAETALVEVAAVGKEPNPATLDEENLNEAEIPEELMMSTVASKNIEEDGLSALVPPPEAVDIVNETLESASDTALFPVDDNSAEGNEEVTNRTDVAPSDEDVNAEQPADGADVNVPLSYPEGPVSEEGIVEEATESEGHDVKEETPSEAPAAEEEVPEAPQISTEDLTEDEILLVNKDKSEQPATDFLSPAQPTALFPERESPFTRIADVNPEGRPDVSPSLVEVTQIVFNVA